MLCCFLLEKHKQAAFAQRKSGCSSPHWNSRLVKMHSEQDGCQILTFALSVSNCELGLTKVIKTFALLKLIYFSANNNTQKQENDRPDESFFSFFTQRSCLEKVRNAFGPFKLFDIMMTLYNCIIGKKYETTLTTRHTLWCKYLFSHDIPLLQNDSPIHFTRQIQECFYETVYLKFVSSMTSKITGSTVRSTLTGCSLAQSVHLVSKSSSSVKQLEKFLLEELSNVPRDTV